MFLKAAFFTCAMSETFLKWHGVHAKKYGRSENEVSSGTVITHGLARLRIDKIWIQNVFSKYWMAASNNSFVIFCLGLFTILALDKFDLFEATQSILN